MPSSVSIESVVEKRRVHAKRLRSLDEKWAEIADMVSVASATLEVLGADSLDLERMRLRAADAAARAQRVVGMERQESTRLADRYSSGRICLAAVGRARQGKSRFLQSLTGLSGEVIPDSDKGYCTGVASTIRSGETSRATVHFLSREAYLSIVNRYFEEFGIGPVVNLEAFWSMPPARPTGALARQDGLYEVLMRHWQDRAAIGSLLGSAPREISISEVSAWVTQPDAHVGGGSSHMAVDRVDITVPYPGGSALVDVIDLPGLGDNNLTDIDRFGTTLRDVADVLVMVRMPNPKGDDWGEEDFRLATAAENALEGVSFADRLFLVLNETLDIPNRHNAERMLESADRRGIHSTGATLIDASSPAAVRRFFDSVRARIPEVVQAGDAVLLARRQESASRALQAVNAFVATASEVIGTATPMPEARHQVLLDHAVRNLVEALNSLAGEVANDRDLDVHGLRADIRALVESAEEFKKEWVQEGDFLKEKARKSGAAGAYGHFLSESRAQLLTHFGQLDPKLRGHLEATKRRVAGVMLQDGRLESVPGLNPQASLSDIRQVLADERLGMPADSFIVGAIETLDEAELAYRGFLQHRVRKALQPLDPNAPLFPVSDFEGPDRNLDPVSAADWVGAIWATIGHSLRLLEEMLADASSDADWAAIALVDEFVHRATGGPDAEALWRAVYARFQESIWREEFAIAAANSAVSTNASRALADLRAAISTAQDLVHADGIED